jgi:hypothetical protein
MLLLMEAGVLKPLSYFGPYPEKFEFRKSLSTAPHRGNLSGRAVLDGHTAHVHGGRARASLAGRRSVSTTPVAAFGPLFATVTVKVMMSPTLGVASLVVSPLSIVKPCLCLPSSV